MKTMYSKGYSHEGEDKNNNLTKIGVKPRLSKFSDKKKNQWKIWFLVYWKV